LFVATFCLLLFTFFKRFADSFVPGTSGLQGLFPQSGPFHESPSLLWQGFIANVIRSTLYFIGKVRYQRSRHGSQEESMDYLEFIARVTSHIPDKGQVMVRYYGLYSNAHRGKMRKAGAEPPHPAYH
jgi:hypothetical protein